MITTKGLIEKGFIDIDDNIEFRTHADVMRLFGTDQKLIQRSFIKHPHEQGTRIWFPMYYDDTNNDWINTASKDYSRVFEKNKTDNEDYLRKLLSEPGNHTRVLFAKVRQGNRTFYKFKGVYKLNIEMTQEHRKAAYDRVATSTRIFSTSNTLT